MDVDILVRVIEKLPLADKLTVMEIILRSIRKTESEKLSKAVDALQNDYQKDAELTAFTALDEEPFHETR